MTMATSGIEIGKCRRAGSWLQFWTIKSCEDMGGPTVVPAYSRAYPAHGGIHLYSIVFHRGIYMYSIVKVSKLRFFTIFSPWAYPALESWVRHCARMHINRVWLTPSSSHSFFFCLVCRIGWFDVPLPRSSQTNDS